MYEHALIVGKFAPLHRGHQFLIERALAGSRALTVLVYATPDFVDMPNAMRAGWIRMLYSGVDCRIPDNPPPDAASDHDHRRFVKQYLAREGIAVDAVFSSEDYGPGFARELGVEHVMVDRFRLNAPVSGTRLRSSPGLAREWLHPLVWHAVRDVSDVDRRG